MISQSKVKVLMIAEEYAIKRHTPPEKLGYQTFAFAINPQIHIFLTINS